MSETIRLAVDEVEEKLKAKLAEASELKRTINSMLALVGDPPRYGDVDTPHKAQSAAVRRDEFFGKSPMTAAREFLEKSGQPQTAEEIFEGLKKGGFDFESSTNWKTESRLRNLAISLTKNTGMFIKLPSNAFGLLKWYPEHKLKKKAGATEATAGAQQTLPDSSPKDDAEEKGDDADSEKEE